MVVRISSSCWRPIAVLCFYSKTGFWPSYCQISPIWIKFCTHIWLYGIHPWADLDRDRRVGGSRPNPNDYFLYTCNVPHSPIGLRRQIATISAANHQSGDEDGCYHQKVRNFVSRTEPNPKTAFSAFLGYPSTILPTAYRKQFYPKPVLPKESRVSEGVPFSSLESQWPGIWQI